MIKTSCLDYGWRSSIAAVSSTTKVLLQGHPGKYSGSLLVPAQESLIPSVNKPKVPKEFSVSQRPGVTPLLSNAMAHVRNSLVPVSVILSVSLLLLLVEKGLLWSLAPPFHTCNTLLMLQAAREGVTVLLASLSFESEFPC